MKRFEYRTLVVPVDESPEAALDRFNGYGADGWQIVWIIAHGERARVWLMRQIDHPDVHDGAPLRAWMDSKGYDE